MNDKNKNEVRRMRDLMNEGLNLAKQYEGKQSPNPDLPETIFSQFEKRRKQIQDSIEDY
jgi:hypothetical protein